MNSALFFEGQDVLVEDLEDLQSYLQNYIKAGKYHLFNKGIIKGYTGYDVLPKMSVGSLNTLVVQKFIGYNSSGELLKSDSILTSLAPGSLGKLVSSGGTWAPSSTYTIVARYTYIDNTQVAHPVTGVLYDTRRADSFDLYALTTTSLPTDVILGTVTTDTGSNITVDNSSIEYFTMNADKISAVVSSSLGATNYSGTINLQDHVSALGTGTVSKTNPHGIAPIDIGLDVSDIATHIKLQHSKGIITSDRSSTTSALYAEATVSLLDTDDYLTIYPLSTDELCAVNGVTVGSGDIPTSLVFTFNGYAAGFYLFYVDSITKTVARSGPYSTITDSILLNNVNASTKAALWTIYWDGSDLFPTSLRDWRQFGTIDNSKISEEALAGMANGILGNRNANFYNARLLSTSTNNYFNVSGKTFIVDPNGVGAKTVTFSGTDPLHVSNVISQINVGITYSTVSALSENNSIKIVSASSLVLGSGTANTDLGFTDGQADTDGFLKTVVITGDIPGYSDLFYDVYSRISYINNWYGNKLLKSELTYSADSEDADIVSIEDTIAY